MKLRVLCILSVFALVLAGGLAAQTATNPADQTQGTMATATVTGTVVSSDNGSLVIDTGNGRQTFMIDSSSTMPSNLSPGGRVTVQYHAMSGNQLHAASVTTMPGSGTTTTGNTMNRNTGRAVNPDVDTTTSTDTTGRTDVSGAQTDNSTTDQSATSGTRQGRRARRTRTAGNLPATGSELPLIALIGLGSLVAAFAVRARSRRTA